VAEEERKGLGNGEKEKIALMFTRYRRLCRFGLSVPRCGRRSPVCCNIFCRVRGRLLCLCFLRLRGRGSRGTGG